MKKGIHPDYKPAKITCACGAVIETHSTAGRVERFNRKYNRSAK